MYKIPGHSVCVVKSCFSRVVIRAFLLDSCLCHPIYRRYLLRKENKMSRYFYIMFQRSIAKDQYFVITVRSIYTFHEKGLYIVLRI